MTPRDDRCTHGDHVTSCLICQRAALLTDLQVVLDELTTRVTTRASVHPDAVPGYRPPTDGRPVPKHVEYRTDGPGLLEQLHNAAGVRPTRGRHDDPTPTPGLLEAGPTAATRYGADTGPASKPGSRPPSSLSALETLARIEGAVLDLRRRADRAAGLGTSPRARGVRGELRHLVWLLGVHHEGDPTRPLLRDPWPWRIYSEARGWVAEARVTLSYVAPVVTLRVRCPDCGGDMRVRADASSDVWCAGRWTVEGPALEDEPWPVQYRCGAVWPRLTWVQLLDQTSSAEATA